jgi:hypothetical protein
MVFGHWRSIRMHKRSSIAVWDPITFASSQTQASHPSSVQALATRVVPRCATILSRLLELLAGRVGRLPFEEARAEEGRMARDRLRRHRERRTPLVSLITPDSGSDDLVQAPDTQNQNVPDHFGSGCRHPWFRVQTVKQHSNMGVRACPQPINTRVQCPKVSSQILLVGGLVDR